MSDSEGSPVKATSTTKAKPAMKKPPAQHPSFADMTIDAVKSISDTKGASVPGIRNFVLEKYKAVDPNTMKYRLKQALTKLSEKEIIVRSKASEDRPLMSSRFRMNKVKLTKESKPKKVVNKTEKTVKTKSKTESATANSTKVKKTAKTTVKKTPTKKTTVKKNAPKSPKTKTTKAKPKTKVTKTTTKVTKTKQPKTPKKTKTASKTGK